MKAWIYLLVGIIGEVTATSALKASQGVTRLVPSVVMVISYLVACVLFSFSLKTILHCVPRLVRDWNRRHCCGGSLILE